MGSAIWERSGDWAGWSIPPPLETDPRERDEERPPLASAVLEDEMARDEQGGEEERSSGDSSGCDSAVSSVSRSPSEERHRSEGMTAEQWAAVQAARREVQSRWSAMEALRAAVLLRPGARDSDADVDAVLGAQPIILPATALYDHRRLRHSRHFAASPDGVD